MKKKTKKNSFTRVFIVLVILILGAVAFFVVNSRSFQSINITQSIKGTGYKFNWDETSKTATVSKNGSQITSFSLTEKPLDVYLYIPRNIFAVITRDKDSLEHLYIYNDNKLTKLRSAQKETVPGVENLSTSFADIEFSPDGNYLTSHESGYEWGASQLFSTKELAEEKISKENPYLLGWNFFWQPQSLCFLNTNSGGMDEPSLKLFQINNGVLQMTKMNNDISYLDQEISVWWNNDCSGVIRLENEKGTKSFYKFDSQGGKLQSTNKSSINKLQKSSNINQEHIYSQK